ncbi:MAG: asparagine synthase C-terminal domain-containing protein, partial [Acidobacteria bacterium]|nr:asparagine synthase C-terminal domain-containing protein [Acidobacteriota bacterium]
HLAGRILLAGMRSLGQSPNGRDAAPVPRKLKALLSVAGRSYPETYCRMMSYFTPELKRSLYSPFMRQEVGGIDCCLPLIQRYADSDGESLLDRILDLDTHNYLPDDLLVKVDITAMAHSLEVRCPFLDHPLVEFAARLPAHWKLRRLTSKFILKKAMRGKLPRGILRRSKMGFGIPLDLWFRNGLRTLVHETVLSDRALERPFFDAPAVRRLVERHMAGVENHGFRLWALVMLELWCRRFLDGRS